MTVAVIIYIALLFGFTVWGHERIREGIEHNRGNPWVAVAAQAYILALLAGIVGTIYLIVQLIQEIA